MSNDEKAVESAIQAAGAIAPRVRPEDLDAEIAAGSVHYFTALDGVRCPVMDGRVAEESVSLTADQATNLQIITICTIVLANGFKVIGTSAPVSAANYREEIGRKVAYDRAREQLWPLLGFRLADQLAWTLKMAKAEEGVPVIGAGATDSFTGEPERQL